MLQALVALTRYLSNRKLGARQSRSRLFGTEKELVPAAIRTPDRPACSLVTISTAPSVIVEKWEIKCLM